MDIRDQDLFGRSGGTSWRRAFIKAAVVEGILLLLSAGAFASAAGADNPLGIYVATALQFPASLLASPLYQAIVNDEHGSDWQAMIFSAITVAALEYGLLVLAFRRPWRR